MGTNNNSDCSSQARKDNERKRRFFSKKEVFFNLRAARIIVEVYFCGKGLALPHCPRLILMHILDKSMKRKVKGGWQVDLAEARWESKTSIAREIGKGLVEYSVKDIENAERKLRKLGIIRTRPIHGSKQNIVGRYLALSENAISIFKDKAQKLNIKQDSDGGDDAEEDCTILPFERPSDWLK